MKDDHVYTTEMPGVLEYNKQQFKVKIVVYLNRSFWEKKSEIKEKTNFILNC